MPTAENEKAFTTAVLELLKSGKHFPYVRFDDIQAATALVKETYTGPLTEDCNAMLVFDETHRLIRIHEGHAA